MSKQPISFEALCPSRFQRLVAVEPAPDGTAALFRREDNGTVTSRRVTFHPWLLTAGVGLGQALPGAVEVHPLKGDARFNTRVHFPDSDTYFKALKFLKLQTGRSPTQPGAPYRVFSDQVQQLLSLLPARLFRGMVFRDILRMQIDIETRTTPGYDFPNAKRAGDEITVIAMRDSGGWERCLAVPEFTEAEMLREMIRLVRERDPDVIEGHNIFDFDLPYIAERCKRHRIRLALGRNGSVVKSRSSRFTAGERKSSYTRFDIYGRHVVDTLHLVRLYDVSHRDMESYGLKAVARYFGVAAEDRTYVRPESITELAATDPNTLRAYAMDDVRETEAISRVLSPSSFYQAQLVPFTYQNCVCRGSATRIDAMLVAAYMERDRSVPEPEPARPFQGGLTDSLETGVFTNVWHADVRSLYPSIIISAGMRPSRDTADVFRLYLAELRRFRLTAKDAARHAASEAEREYFDALQSSFKILINSFYGYLGFSQGTFNDYRMAEAVTARGREVLRSMLSFLESQEAVVIEMDTDGLYFVPPASVSDPGEMQRRIQEKLPPGIEVEVDATYAAMFGYKSKNYALLDHNGKVLVTGAALKSRGLEPFQRRYIHQLIELMLTGRGAEAPALYERTAEAIRNHTLPLADFAKREVLSTPPRVYAEKLEAGTARRSAAYELVLRSGREYSQGDQVAFYVTGNKKNVAVADAAKLLADADPAVRDENIPYYLDKLAKLHAKFAAFLPQAPDASPGLGLADA
ncbi:MAG: DNA polymerase II [Kiritimatiellaeota bacterium]|nr:DNA polymerase II [Kiritimatiellota bacterium]